MLKQIKIIGTVACMSLILAGLYGCGGATEVTQDADEGRGDVIPEEESTDYASLYLGEIEKLASEGLADQFVLVNIDEDDIPELIASDSTGSYEHENSFIYTVSDGNAVLLAKAMTGVDGVSLSFCEGKNLIREAGGLMGQTDTFSKIDNGKLSEVFKAEALISPETDENGEEIYTYSVNGKDVDKAAYLDEFTKFIEPYAPLVSIDYDGLNKIKYTSDQDAAWFEVTETGKYSTKDEITKQLEK